MNLTQTLLLKAPNNRHGIVLEPQAAVLSMSDLPSVKHVGVPSSLSSPWQSAAGGVGYSKDVAQMAAIGEAIERYVAAIVQLPLKNRRSIPPANQLEATEWNLFTSEQRARSGFPFHKIYDEDCPYTSTYDFQDNREIWIPQPLVVLRDDYQTGVPTSSGLAAGSSAQQALLRAIQELIERDALMMTWLHSLAARAISVPEKYEQEIKRLGGEVWAFELTPSYSPFPVIAVAGGIPKKGKWRYSLGVACRDTWQSALDKAYLEWNQGVLFAGIYEKYVDTSYITKNYALKTFDEHAIYYTLHPEQWSQVPMFKNKHMINPVAMPGSPINVENALIQAKKAFKKHSIRLYYRDLTTVDARQLGLSVVRATSPDFANIFAHQEWPLLGNLESALKSRYTWALGTGIFPNLLPHPLG